MELTVIRPLKNPELCLKSDTECFADAVSTLIINSQVHSLDLTAVDPIAWWDSALRDLAKNSTLRVLVLKKEQLRPSAIFALSHFPVKYAYEESDGRLEFLNALEFKAKQYPIDVQKQKIDMNFKAFCTNLFALFELRAVEESIAHTHDVNDSGDKLDIGIKENVPLSYSFPGDFKHHFIEQYEKLPEDRKLGDPRETLLYWCHEWEEQYMVWNIRWLYVENYENVYRFYYEYEQEYY